MFKDQVRTNGMTVKRIVSFLPSATELLYELNVQDMLYGVTHECLYPEDAKTKPKVITSVINSEELSSKEINDKTCELLNQGKDIFVLNEQNLQNANPELIISQETCEVCAAYTNQVTKAIRVLQNKPIVHSMDPHNLDEILESVIDVGKIIGKEKESSEIIKDLKKRINYIKDHHITTKPNVLAIEWIDPFFTSGHWVPEMIENAGGKNLVSSVGEHSRRMTMDEIIKADPEIIILMPCGFNVKRTIEEYKILQTNEKWNGLKAVQNNKVFAVDANAYFSKPSIRTITGIEILAKILHPEIFDEFQVPVDSFKII